ncbi:MAG TPA: hypothetical protein VMU71_03580 [Terracidiphilus sp.]|nr:hypothetical protein [Terracidiphilus sp.]
MTDRDELDRRLDSALSAYAVPGPDFEERLLSSIALADRARPARRRPWLSWAIAISAAACLLIALSFFLHPRQRQTGNAQQARSAPVPREKQQEQAAAAPASTEGRRQGTRSVARNTPRAASVELAKLPKRDVFPTPQPLSPAEQAFVRYVAAAPEKDRRALIEAQAQQDAPLEISAIKIAPLTISSPDQTGIQGEP